MTEQRYWTQFVGPDGAWRTDPQNKQPKRPPGEDLAAMRAGLGREAGSVFEMFRFYACEIDDRLARRDEVSTEMKAEHAALALFGLHQQSQDQPMHRPGIKLGQALRALRQSEKYSEAAVDARVAATVAATSVPVLLMRLRDLITQLRAVHQPLDYDLLLQDIRSWHRPEAREGVRRKWGLGYHVWAQPKTAEETPVSSDH